MALWRIACHAGIRVAAGPVDAGRSASCTTP
jgi:hypothetical protein